MNAKWRITRNFNEEPRHACLELASGALTYDIFDYSSELCWSLQLNRFHLKYYKTLKSAMRAAERHAMRTAKRVEREIEQ